MDQYNEPLPEALVSRIEEPPVLESEPEVSTSLVSTRELPPKPSLVETEEIQKLTSIMSDEWLKDAELSSEEIQINTAPRLIPCHLEGNDVGILYSPTVSVNIVSKSFVFAYLSNKTITQTDKFFKQPNGSILKDLGLSKMCQSFMTARRQSWISTFLKSGILMS
jgi:hypothetical protein